MLKQLYLMAALTASAYGTTAAELNLDIDEATQWTPVVSSEPRVIEGIDATEKIMGTPDFKKVSDLPARDPDVQLSQKVGQFWLYDGENLRPHCSGSLVGPDLFLTNHHCVFDSKNNSYIKPKEIVIAMEHVKDSFGEKGTFTIAREILKHNKELDFALLRLHHPLGDRYGYLQLEDDKSAINNARAVKIIQHPAGRSKEIVKSNTNTINCPHTRITRAEWLCYLADTEGGSSGSPVFSLDGEKIIALHHIGISGMCNAGTQITYVAEQIRDYLPVVGATTTQRPSQPEPPKSTPVKQRPTTPATTPAVNKQPSQQPPTRQRPPAQTPDDEPEPDDSGWRPITG